MTYEAAVERLRAVAQAAQQLPASLPNGVPDLAAAQVRLSEGLPALAGEPLLDWPALSANVRKLGGTVDDLARTIEPAALVEAALSGAWDTLGSITQQQVTLLDYATRPALRAGWHATRDIIATTQWARGNCPSCGSLPAIAELHSGKEGQGRVLRCGRCTAAWAFDRLTCPACGERDHAQLRYLHVDGEVAFRRAECCLTCGFYVKAVARLDPLSSEELLDVDLETVGLDALAMEAGYRR